MRNLALEVELACAAIRRHREREAEEGDFPCGLWREHPPYPGEVVVYHPTLCEVLEARVEVYAARKPLREAEHG